MRVFAIIMAGGIGSRFWPRSREKTPKQLLKIFGEDTIIQSTIKRVKLFVAENDIFIVTNAVQAELMKVQLPAIPAENFILEPFGRNTAACIGLASIKLKKIDPTAVSLVLPADHLIHDLDKFMINMKQAINTAYEKKVLVTIGIPPTRPETGYGYIQIDNKENSPNVFRVNSFAEKPNYATAVRFLASGDFMWNSGMFIWRIDTILEELKTYMHDLNYGLSLIEKSQDTPEYETKLLEIYAQLKSISIDYGIMEKSKRVFLVKSEFRWSDIGSWEEVYQLSDKDEQGNSFEGPHYADMTAESYVYSPDKFTALIGVENLIVINTPDALLICRRDQAQRVKQAVDFLQQNDKKELL